MAIQDLEWSGDAFDRLDELRQARDLLDWMIDRAVTECRRGEVVRSPDVVNGETQTAEFLTPISWRRIGDQLGISRQAAWERYRHNEP